MKPGQLISTLRRIASSIERSKNPDRNLVARDLKKVVATLLGEYNVMIKGAEVKMTSVEIEKFLREKPSNEVEINVNGQYILFYMNDDGVVYNSDIPGVEGDGYDSVDDAVADATNQIINSSRGSITASSKYYVIKNWGKPEKMSSEEVELFLMRRTSNRAIVEIPGYVITLSMDNSTSAIHYLVNSKDMHRCGIMRGTHTSMDAIIPYVTRSLKSMGLM